MCALGKPSLIGIINVVKIIHEPLWQEEGINNARGSRKPHPCQYFKFWRLKISHLNWQCDEVDLIMSPIWWEMHGLNFLILLPNHTSVHLRHVGVISFIFPPSSINWVSKTQHLLHKQIHTESSSKNWIQNQTSLDLAIYYQKSMFVDFLNECIGPSNRVHYCM